MANYKLNLTGAEIDERLAQVPEIAEDVGALKSTIANIPQIDGLAVVDLSDDPTPPIVHVESVVLDYSSYEMKNGEVFYLAASVLPENATNKSVVWNTTNADVVTVEDGMVTAVGDGSAIISVRSVDGNISAECSINVVNEGGHHKVYLADVPLTQSIIRKAGTINTEAGAWSAVIPYKDGMTVSGCMRKTWKGNYSIAVVTNSAGDKQYSANDVEGVALTSAEYQYEATLSGYDADSTVTINMYMGANVNTESLAKEFCEVHKDQLFYEWED